MRHVRVFVKNRSANMKNIRQRQEVEGKESTSVLQNGHKDRDQFDRQTTFDHIFS